MYACRDEREVPQALVMKMLDEYAASEHALSIDARCRTPGPGVDVASVHTVAGLQTQIRVLFARSKNNVLRNRMILRAKIGQCIFFGLLVGLIWRSLTKTQRGINM